MNQSKQFEMMSAKAIFLTAITRNGPEILTFQPSLDMPEKDRKELAFKSIPMSSKDGDFISCSLPNYQAACLINQVPPFEQTMDTRDTFVSFGMILDKNANPIPYRNVLEKITNTCRENNLLTFEILEKISNQLLKSITITQECTFTLEVKKGVKVEFEFIDAFTEWVEKNGHKEEEKELSEKLYEGVLSTEEALKREKSAFVLDKTILKAICSEGPLSIDDLRRKTLPLEDVLGMKIDVDTIEEILQKYIKEGIIKTIRKE